MAEVILCYAREDAAAARRLAATVSGQGYGLWSEQDLAGDGEGGDVTDRISSAGAAIVIWSAAAAASEWVRAEANFARGQHKLIQATIDDTPPPLPFKPADIVSIADWQGEDSHPGWRRIRARLEQLCGPPRAAGAAIATAAAATAAPTPPASAPPRRRSRGGLVAGLTLALLAAVALATFVWMRDLAPTAPRRPGPPTTSPAVPRSSPAAPPTASIIDPVAPEPPPAEPAVVASEPPARPQPAGPRIIRENSENMRLFCERAGRGTPECRTFARRLRSQSR